MKREDYKEQYKLSKTNVNPLIDRIFDDFESRICGNCEFYHQGYLCLEFGDGEFQPYKEFGCNKWELKE